MAWGTGQGGRQWSRRRMERACAQRTPQASKARNPCYAVRSKGFNVFGVADGTRTHDDQNHNLGLYQLSYSHRKPAIINAFWYWSGAWGLFGVEFLGPRCAGGGQKKAAPRAAFSAME